MLNSYDATAQHFHIFHTHVDRHSYDGFQSDVQINAIEEEYVKMYCTFRIIIVFREGEKTREKKTEDNVQKQKEHTRSTELK